MEPKLNLSISTTKCRPIESIKAKQYLFSLLETTTLKVKQCNEFLSGRHVFDCRSSWRSPEPLCSLDKAEKSKILKMCKNMPQKNDAPYSGANEKVKGVQCPLYYPGWPNCVRARVRPRLRRRGFAQKLRKPLTQFWIKRSVLYVVPRNKEIFKTLMQNIPPRFAQVRLKTLWYKVTT